MSFRRSWDNKIAYRSISTVAAAVPVQEVEEAFPWKRNPSWLQIQEVQNTDTKFVGLYAIEPDSSFCAISIGLDATGSYTVDWGDGTTDTISVTGTTAALASKIYDYQDSALDNTDGPVTFSSTGNLVTRNNHGYDDGDFISFAIINGSIGIQRFVRYFVINSTEDTFQISEIKNGTPIEFDSDGTGSILFYRQAIVTITTEAERQIRIFNMNVRHPQNNIFYETGWLDYNFSFPNLTTLTLAAAGAETVRNSMLERTNPVNLGNITAFSTGYNNNYNLQKVENINLPSNCNSLLNLFIGCVNLYKVGEINNTVNITSFSAMFSGCRNLRNLPEMDTQNGTNFSSFALNCTDIISVPKYDFSNATTLSSVFSGCFGLEDIPPINSLNSTIFSNIFSNCLSVKNLNFIDTQKGISLDSMAVSCRTSVNMPSYDLNSALNISNAFNSMYTIRRLPPMNFTNATNISAAFSTMTALKKTYDLNFNSATTITNLFFNCRNIRKLSTLQFGSNQFNNTTSVFNGCTNLTSVPLFDTSNVTIFTTMFNGCTSLRSIPDFDTSSALTLTSMFNGCTILRKTPNLNISNATTLTNMFLNCSSLNEIVNYDFSSTLIADSAFRGLTIIDNLPSMNFPVCTNLNAIFNANISIFYMPNIQIGGTNVSINDMFGGMLSLIEVPAINMSNTNSLVNTYTGALSLKAIKATGMRTTFTIATRNFSSTALNEIYTNLATVSGQSITVSANYGTTTDTPSIATNKGWSVIGS